MVKSTGMDPRLELVIVGGGLAGCEAAWQAAERGIQVTLYEMRPQRNTEVHSTGQLAELVCSNSLGSKLADRASGMIKQELNCMGSLLLTCALKTEIPAGGALAVDRTGFSDLATQMISTHPLIKLMRAEVTEIPNGSTIIASGPLTSLALSSSLRCLTGEDYLFFFDAVAPVITAESIDMSTAFRASRYHWDQIDGDYINCPMSRTQYDIFIEELTHAERAQLRHYEQAVNTGVRAGVKEYFEGCLPVEVLAQRDPKALAFGPMRPVGLREPRTGRSPHAVVQLRQDNMAASLYNMVGFQTNLTYQEQKRVFRLIPGLENAEFSRYGQMHRNTFIASPHLLSASLQFRKRQDLFFAGQITGVEGYIANIATGWLAGVNAVRNLRKKPLLVLPRSTMAGALCHYIANVDMKDFQPVKANFGLIMAEGIEKVGDRRERNLSYSQKGVSDLKDYLISQGENVF